MSASYPWGLFQVTGVEIEYMIVDCDTLSVRPIADRLLRALPGGGEGEGAVGQLACSNELALHLIELKTSEPVKTLAGVADRFQQGVAQLNRSLAQMNARLMPSGMHPWMDPGAELELWPHEYGAIYRAFDRIFDCRGHGWANLQSTHVNLPFGSDEEFGRLHAALRILLPILPALAASSPVADGKLTGSMDSRLDFYVANSRRVPSVSGAVVPEPVFSRKEYESVILQPIYDDLWPHDPDGTLRHEWVNARGCIARFDRGAIEIRLLDVQECPAADVAVAAAVAAVAQGLVGEKLAKYDWQRQFATQRLAAILAGTIKDAEASVISDREYLGLLGYPGQAAQAGELWWHLVENTMPREAGREGWYRPLGVILSEGPLARRLARRLGGDCDRQKLQSVYRELCWCLQEGVMFDGESGRSRVDL